MNVDASIPGKLEVARAQFGPRAAKDPRSREYAIQTVHALKRYAESLKCDEDLVAKELAVIEQYECWIALGYATRDAMLDAMLSDRGRAVVLKLTPMQRTQAAAAQATTDVLPEGRPAKARDETALFTQLSQAEKAAASGVSRSVQQRLDTLARRAPELLEEVKAGRMSANAAAIAAGIVHPTWSAPVDPERLALALAKRYPGREFNRKE